MMISDNKAPFIRILNAGPLCTVQDSGRFGYMSSGVGQSGVMDMRSYKQANYLVDNDPDDAVLETTLFGPTIEFTDPTIFALTGADQGAKLDGTPIDRGRPFIAAAGQKLVLGAAVSGIRGYISFHGGIDVPCVMNSRSTNLKCHIGGHEGRALKAGDELPLGDGLSPSKVPSVLARYIKPARYPHEFCIRVIPGPQDDAFSNDAYSIMTSSEYKVTDKSDRMGIRLEGCAIPHIGKADIVSDGIVFGSIQVPSNGQPIILMADHQTTGGYTKIATVASPDLPLLAQACPGDTIHINLTTVGQIQWEIRDADSYSAER